jgi:hypothetical protein
MYQPRPSLVWNVLQVLRLHLNDDAATEILQKPTSYNKKDLT